MQHFARQAAVLGLAKEKVVNLMDAIAITKTAEGKLIVPLREHLALLLTEEDVDSLAARVPADSAALILLWQNTWTENIRRAIANANGKLLGQERIPAKVVDEVMAEMTASKE